MQPIKFCSDPSTFATAEASYLAVRKAEGRVLTPEALRMLPRAPAGDPHVREWRIRAATTDRLIAHLRKHFHQPRILDLGCGPGWMIARIVTELDATAVGIDCNRSELERGAEAFSSVEGLELVYGDIFEPVVEVDSFDAVLVSAALQYFPDPRSLLNRLLQLLKTDGEILIADTALYSKDEVGKAAERSMRYYTELGFPEMADYYHHHTMDDLADFSPTTLYDPQALVSRIARRWLRRPLSPFPILAISAGSKR